MKLFLSLLFLSSLIYSNVSKGSVIERIKLDQFEKGEQAVPLFYLSNFSNDTIISDSTFVPKKRKLKAVLLSILLGHFGVHRIYLGTSANVPVAYSLTLGGGLGLLPLIDTILIIQSDNLDDFANNEKVIMWSKKKATQP